MVMCVRVLDLGVLGGQIVGVLSLSKQIDCSLLYNFMRSLPVIVMTNTFPKPPTAKLNVPPGGHIGSSKMAALGY